MQDEQNTDPDKQTDNILPNEESLAAIAHINQCVAPYGATFAQQQEIFADNFNIYNDATKYNFCYALDNQGYISNIIIYSFKENPDEIFRYLIASRLTHITLLDVHTNQLPPISHLSSLKFLKIQHSPIKTLKGIENLTQLTHLELNNTEISDLDGIENLTQLTHLNCSNTKINNLKGIKGLTKLTFLSCYNTNIINLREIEELTNLETIFSLNCKIKTLPSFITKFKLPITFTLDIPKDGIHLYYNPLVMPPPEIIRLGNSTIDQYFNSLKGEVRQLDEAKLVLVGEGAAGKTSLLDQLINNTFDENKRKTDGIAIKKWEVTDEEGPIKIHCWDFGGQEIMRATHQIFLSRRCVYIIVLDSRKDENVEHWLKQVMAVSKDSPIFIVSNKIDEQLDNNLTQQQLKDKYPQIVDFYQTSCKTGEGIEALKEEIITHAGKLEMRRYMLAENWFKVKEHLETLASEQNYISYDEYVSQCKKHNIDDPDVQEILLKLLHDLGLIIHFEELTDLQTQVLNPEWITEGIYTLINSEILTKQQGLINTDDVGKLLDKKYPCGRYRAKPRYLMEVMRQFELCYQISNSKQYLVPDLLPTELEKTPKLEQGAEFIYKYDGYMPPELMPRFIVKSHTYQTPGKVWRGGVLLQHKKLKSQALITIDREDRTIRINTYGGDQRGFLTIVRNYLNEINNGYQKENIGLEEFIPFRIEHSEKESLIAYSRLEQLEKLIIEKGEIQRDEQYDHIQKTDYSVIDLLNGIQAKEERHKKYQEERSVNIENTHNINLQANPTITQNNEQKSQQSSTQQTTVSISIEIKSLASSLKNWGEDTLEELKELPETKDSSDLKRAEKELQKANNALNDISNVTDKKDAEKNIGKFTRVADFIKGSIDGKTKTGKLLKTAGEGVEKLQSFGRKYNKIATHFGLQPVPGILLGSEE